ncbi:MAG: hypothetical protein V3V08_04640 [Nannocystaceae bacterium]
MVWPSWFRTFKLELGLGHRLALAVVALWAASLVCVRSGARLEALAPLPVVGKLVHCRMDRVPASTEISGMIATGERVVVRDLESVGDFTCLNVEFQDGTRGWVPWHRGYLRDAGYSLTFGW